MPKLKALNFVNVDSQVKSLLLSLPKELLQVIAEYFSEKEMKSILQFALTSKRSYQIGLVCMQKELIMKTFLTLPTAVKQDDVLAVKKQVLKNLDDEETVDQVLTTIDSLSLTSRKVDKIGNLLKKYGFMPRAKIELLCVLTAPMGLLCLLGSLLNIKDDPQSAALFMIMALAFIIVSALVCIPRFVGSCTDDQYKINKEKKQTLVAKFGTFAMLNTVTKTRAIYPQMDINTEDLEAGESMRLL